MSAFTEKILNFIKLNDDDEDDDYDSYDEDSEDYEPPKKTSRSTSKTTYDLDDDVRQEPKPAKRISKAKVVPMKNKNDMEVCVIKPVTIEDGCEIADTLVSGIAVILNLEGIHVELAQRIIDFTSGACYAIRGTMQKVSNYIFIASPPTVEISGDVQEIIDKTSAKLSEV